MTGLINKIYQKIIIKNPIITILFLIFILGFFSLYIKNFELDASADSLILEDDEDLKIFRKIISRYDTKDFVIITYKPNEDLFSLNSFKNIKDLKNKLQNLENVHEVITLIDLPLLKAANVPLKKLDAKKIKRITDPEININHAKKEILESPIFKNLIVSEDGQLTSLIVNLKRDEQFIKLLRKRNDLKAKEKLGIEEGSSIYVTTDDDKEDKKHVSIRKIEKKGKGNHVMVIRDSDDDEDIEVISGDDDSSFFFIDNELISKEQFLGNMIIDDIKN